MTLLRVTQQISTWFYTTDHEIKSEQDFYQGYQQVNWKELDKAREDLGDSDE